MKKAITRLERNLALSRRLLEESQDIANQSYYSYRVETINTCIELLRQLQDEAAQLLKLVEEQGGSIITGEENE